MSSEDKMYEFLLECKLQKIGETKLNKILKESEKVFAELPTNTGAEGKKNIAAFHGIDVETLVNSPNYKELKKEFDRHTYKEAVMSLQSKLGLEREELEYLMTKAGLVS